MTALTRLDIDGHVATLFLDSPPLNIITTEMRPEILTALSTVRSSPAIRALIVTGAGGRAFCAGADLNEEAELTPATVREFLEADRQVFDGLTFLPIPVIAAINGHCMGGGLELALSCDLRVTAETAKHRAAGVRMGLVVSTTRMTRIAGPAVAKDLILTGRTFTGDEALRLGLANRAVPHDEVLARATDLAQEIASRAPLAVRQAKASITEAEEMEFDEAMAREFDHFAELSASTDHKEAVQAFFDRRPPEFIGE